MQPGVIATAKTQPNQNRWRDMEARVQALRARAQREQRSFNQSLRSRKDFGNPHLIAKLSKRLGLQDGTNYPPHIYDPAFIQAEDFYDALTLQQHDWEQARQAARKGSTDRSVSGDRGSPTPDITGHKTVRMDPCPKTDATTSSPLWARSPSCVLNYLDCAGKTSICLRIPNDWAEFVGLSDAMVRLNSIRTQACLVPEVACRSTENGIHTCRAAACQLVSVGFLPDLGVLCAHRFGHRFSHVDSDTSSRPGSVKADAMLSVPITATSFEVWAPIFTHPVYRGAQVNTTILHFALGPRDFLNSLDPLNFHNSILLHLCSLVPQSIRRSPRPRQSPDEPLQETKDSVVKIPLFDLQQIEKLLWGQKKGQGWYGDYYHDTVSPNARGQVEFGVTAS
eukprot:g58445.t1